MHPFDAIDFEKRDWVPFSGWPFDKSHLDPFYHKAQKTCKITPATFDVADWENPEDTPALPFVGERVKTVIFKFGSRHPLLDGDAAGVIKAKNITTYLYSNVIEIETNDTARTVTRLSVKCLEGNQFWVKSKLIILAAGAIEIPRLLLTSNKIQIAGLGNQHDLVGRFFMEHPHFSSGFFVPASVEIFKFTHLYDHIHKVSDVPIIGKLSLSEEVVRQEKVLNYVVELSPRIALNSSLNQFLYPRIDSKSVRSYKTLRCALRQKKLPDDIGSHLRNILTGLDDFTVTGYRNIKKRFLRVVDKRRIRLFRLDNMTEQAPNPQSRVTLGSDRDRLGQRRVQLDWRLSDFDKQSFIKSQKIVDLELRKAGLGRLYTQPFDEIPPDQIKGGWHHMGTTRMHLDPKYGVVDPNGRVHGISNLFISGPSVFPTSGYANPSLTIIALAERMADHIKTIMKR
jgi:choline dehydrogenase-like flavoprotein